MNQNLKRNSEDKKSFRILEIILINLILILIFVMFFSIHYMRTEGSKCLASPLIYGAKQMEKSYDSNFFCTCSIAKPNTAIIGFSSQGFTNDILKFYTKNQTGT